MCCIETEEASRDGVAPLKNVLSKGVLCGEKSFPHRAVAKIGDMNIPLLISNEERLLGETCLSRNEYLLHASFAVLISARGTKFSYKFLRY